MKKDRICNIIYQEFSLILGDMIFSESDDKVIVHKIDRIIECDSIADALATGEALISKGAHDSYLVPSEYEGDIICEYKN